MDAKLIQDLVDVGTGKLPHVYRGRCPDSLEGPGIRDRGCPACKVLIAGTRAAKALATTPRSSADAMARAAT